MYPLDPTLIVVRFASVGGERGTMQLLTQQTSRPTALFLMNVLMVIGALRAIARLDCAAHKTLRCCLMNLVVSSHAAPLTTVRQPIYEIVRKQPTLI